MFEGSKTNKETVRWVARLESTYLDLNLKPIIR